MAHPERTDGEVYPIGDLIANQHQNAVRILGVVAAVGGWWILSLFYPPTLIPGPEIVFAETYDVFVNQEFLYHFENTIVRVLASFLLAMASATALGIAMGSSDTLEGFFEPFVLVGLTVPSLAIAMVMLLIFGINNVAAVAAVTLTMIPIVTENMWEGTKNLDPELLRMGHAFEAGRRSILQDIVLPQLVPYVLAASRFGLSIAWKVVVIVEFLGLGNGIGFKIKEQFGLYSFTGVLAWTLSFVLVMMVLEYGVLKSVERRLTRWRSSVEGGELTRR